MLQKKAIHFYIIDNVVLKYEKFDYIKLPVEHL